MFTGVGNLGSHPFIPKIFIRILVTRNCSELPSIYWQYMHSVHNMASRSNIYCHCWYQELNFWCQQLILIINVNFAFYISINNSRYDDAAQQLLQTAQFNSQWAGLLLPVSLLDSHKQHFSLLESSEAAKNYGPCPHATAAARNKRQRGPRNTI